MPRVGFVCAIRGQRSDENLPAAARSRFCVRKSQVSIIIGESRHSHTTRHLHDGRRVVLGRPGGVDARASAHRTSRRYTRRNTGPTRGRSRRASRGGLTHRRSESEHPNPATLHQIGPHAEFVHVTSPRVPPLGCEASIALHIGQTVVFGVTLGTCARVGNSPIHRDGGGSGGSTCTLCHTQLAISGRKCVQAGVLHCVARDWSFSSRPAGPTCSNYSPGHCAAPPASSYPPCYARDGRSC